MLCPIIVVSPLLLTWDSMPLPQVSSIETAIDQSILPSERRIGNVGPEQDETLCSNASSSTCTLKLFTLEQIYKSLSLMLLLLLLLFLLALLPLVDCCHCHHCCRRHHQCRRSKMCLFDGVLLLWVSVLVVPRNWSNFCTLQHDSRVKALLIPV